MQNQVTIEGHIVSQWQYKSRQYLRLASHRPQRGRQVNSDYVTVQAAPDLALDGEALSQGTLIRVSGSIWGRDIYEPLRRVLEKAGIEAELPDALADQLIVRPTTQILASQINIISDLKAENQEKMAAQIKERKPRAGKSKPADTPLPAGDARVQPGVDLASLIEA